MFSLKNTLHTAIFRSVRKPISLLAANFALIWLIVYFRVPDKWIGLKDGYYYSIWIKTFTNSSALQDLNGSSYVSYPFYWFWFWGRIYAFFGISSPSNFYAITALTSFSLGILLANYILQKAVTPSSAYAMILFFELYFHLTNQVQIWQKPHEHFAFLISASCFIYFSTNILNNTTNIKDFILTGLLVGLSFGVYSPAVLILAPGIALLILFKIREINKKSLFYFFTFFILVSLPQIYVTGKTLWQFKKMPTPMVYQVTEFFPNLWIPFTLLVFTSLIFFLKIKEVNSPIVLAIKIQLLALGLLYFCVQLAYFFNVILNRADIIMISATIFLIWLPLLVMETEWILKTELQITAMILLLITFFANTAPQYPGADTDFRSNIEISNGRASNLALQQVSQIYSNGYCGQKIFSNDELRFLPAAVKCNSPMALPFNEGNSGPDIDYQPLVLNLDEALREESREKLKIWLEKSGATFLAFIETNDEFSFDFLINNGYPQSGTVPYPTFKINAATFKSLLDRSWIVIQDVDNVFVANKLK